MTNWAPGFYDDGHGARRWWNGQEWTSHVEGGTAAVASELQRDILGAKVATYVAQGWSVEHQDGRQAVLSRRIPLSVILNLIGVFLTGGLWLIYVLVRIASPRYERRVLAVDVNGVVSGAY